jgi:hypothetical protein
MNIRAHGRRALARWSATGVIAGVLLIGACEGSNLFEGGVADDPPRVTSLTVPTSVDAGEVLNVQVSGSAPRGIRFIEVRFSGAATDTVRDDFNGSNPSTGNTTASVTVGQSGTGSVMVTAFVQDTNGTNSQFETRTVTVNPTLPGAPQDN